jgi:hypothetical protein
MTPNNPCIPANPCVPGKPITGFRVLYQVNYDNNGVATGSAAVVAPDGDPSGCVAAVYSSPQPLVTPSLRADGLKDQDESDVDCGGAACAQRCPIGGLCNIGSDCHSGQCNEACVCSALNNTCIDDTDCCTGLTCQVNHLCQ